MFRRLALLAGTLASLLALPVSTTHATVITRSFQDKESDRDVSTGLVVKTGDTVQISCTGSIWAGVLFTGTNGPQGWDNINFNSKYPLPGTHPYMQLGRLDQGYFEIGKQTSFVHTGAPSTLFLRINDDTPGNGNGYFTCYVTISTP